jgi:hypothetical protein
LSTLDNGSPKRYSPAVDHPSKSSRPNSPTENLSSPFDDDYYERVVKNADANFDIYRVPSPVERSPNASPEKQQQVEFHPPSPLDSPNASPETQLQAELPGPIGIPKLPDPVFSTRKNFIVPKVIPSSYRPPSNGLGLPSPYHSPDRIASPEQHLMTNKQVSSSSLCIFQN